MTDKSGFAANIALDEDGGLLQFGTHSICLELLQDKYGSGDFLPREIVMDKNQVATGATWTPSSFSLSIVDDGSTDDNEDSSTFSRFERVMSHPLSEEVRKYSFTRQYEALPLPHQPPQVTTQYPPSTPDDSTTTSMSDVDNVLDSAGCCMQTLTTLFQSFAG